MSTSTPTDTVSRAATLDALTATGWVGRVDGLGRAAASRTVAEDTAEYASLPGSADVALALPGVIDALMSLHPDITLAEQPTFVADGDLTLLVLTVQFPFGLPDPSELRLTVRPTPFESGDGDGAVVWTAICERLFLLANLGSPAEITAMEAVNAFLDAHFRLELRRRTLLRLEELGAPEVIIESSRQLISKAVNAITD